jgi:hypothetical protein
LTKEGKLGNLTDYAENEAEMFWWFLKRANSRLRMFRKDGDFTAFERIAAEGVEQFSMRLRAIA